MTLLDPACRGVRWAYTALLATSDRLRFEGLGRQIMSEPAANLTQLLRTAASRIIRRILVDHARERLAAKRGGRAELIAIEQADLAAPAQRLDLIALDEALAELAELDARQAKIVELRFFGGLTIEEVADSLSMGARSVDREWRAAKAWLSFRLGGSDADDSDG